MGYGGCKYRQNYGINTYTYHKNHLNNEEKTVSMPHYRYIYRLDLFASLTGITIFVYRFRQINSGEAMAEHNELGKWGEDMAEIYLRNKGYDIVERDWRDGHRDIDIIAVEGSTIAFVEVKTRSDNAYIDPVQAVTPAKMRMLSIAANKYIRTHYLHLSVRFDVIGVTGTPDGEATINHIEDAFPPFPLKRGW